MDDGQLHILLVEDDEVDVMSIRRTLLRGGIDCVLHVAGNGLEALRRLRNEGEETPIPRDRRIVLLDLNLPLMGGIEFLRRLRRDPDLQHTDVIVVTTSAEEQDRMQANQLEVVGYMIKPIPACALRRMAAAYAPARCSSSEDPPLRQKNSQDSSAGQRPSQPGAA